MRRRRTPPAAAALVWNAMRLPPGFRMTVRSAQMLPGSTDPVDHLVFSDGLASVSVFVEAQQAQHRSARRAAADPAPSAHSSAFSTVVDGHKVTAVGEVPPATVQFIATQVQGRQDAMAALGDAGTADSDAPAAARLTVVHAARLRLCEEMLHELRRPGPARCRCRRSKWWMWTPIRSCSGAMDLNVPVLLLDGTVVCRHRLDAGRADTAAARAARRRALLARRAT